MTCSFALRPSTTADCDAIAEIWHSSASLPGVGPPMMPTEAELRKEIDAEPSAGWQVTLAICGDEVVGFLAIRPDEAVLAELFVRPGSLGKGIGQALLARAIGAMPDGFTLFTRPGNTRARRFYEKAGLVVLREATHPQFGDPIVYYEWRRR